MQTRSRRMTISPESMRRANAIIEKVFRDVRRSTQLAMQVTAVEAIKGKRSGTKMVMISMKQKGLVLPPGTVPPQDAFEWYADSAGRPTGRGFPCLWSGEKTIRPEARFIPGYDAKLKGQLQKIMAGKADITSISLEARWFLATDQVCGFKIREGTLQRVTP